MLMKTENVSEATGNTLENLSEGSESIGNPLRNLSIGGPKSILATL
jgi:hypothetical protein